jgi:hypothetical protein
MKLTEVILQCDQYLDSDEFMFMVYAKRVNGKFEPFSEAQVLQLTLDEMKMKLIDIANSKCPGYEYFLEMNIIQDFFHDIKSMVEYKLDNEKVKRIIHYAEFDG